MCIENHSVYYARTLTVEYNSINSNETKHNIERGSVEKISKTVFLEGVIGYVYHKIFD